MGSWNLFHFNAPHKVAMGWVPLTGVQSVTTDGLYTIAPLEVGGSGIQALKISKPDTGESYYVGYRQPLGFDASLPAGITRGASVHIWNDNPGTQTKFVDTTPGNGFSDAALADSASFVDSINGVTVRQLSHNATAATVSVSLGTGCVQVAPTLAVSPLSQTGSAGKTLSYTLSVTNNDNAFCAASSFNLGSKLPAESWTSAFSPASLSLAPGATGSSTWSVTSPPDALDGGYIITGKIVVETETDPHAAAVDAAYVVFTDTAPPTVSITSPVNGATVPRRSTVTITASASDNDRVTQVEFYVNDQLKCTDLTSPFSCAWRVPNPPGRTYRLQAKAYDPANNVGTSAIVTVTSR